MIQESAQLLSTAHRAIDGRLEKFTMLPALYRNLNTLGWTGKREIAVRLLPGESVIFDSTPTDPDDMRTVKGWTVLNKQAMLATHGSHPSSIWTRDSAENYQWLYRLFQALCAEKDFRYPDGPNETLHNYGGFLSKPPTGIKDEPFVEPPLAMPAGYKIKRPDDSYDTVASYRAYYIGDKYYFAKWTNRQIPRWFLAGISTVWADDPESRVKVLMDESSAKKTSITLNHVKKYLPSVYNTMVV